MDERESRRSSSPVILDDTSKKIIELLQQDGRQPYAAVAKEVGLSEPATRQRVQRLLDDGVIKIMAVSDPLRVGFFRQAMVGIRVSGDPREVAAQLSAVREVDYVVLCAGSFDLLVELVCEDDAQLLRLLTDTIRTTPGVVAAETFVYLQMVKQTYNWGTP